MVDLPQVPLDVPLPPPRIVPEPAGTAPAPATPPPSNATPPKPKATAEPARTTATTPPARVAVVSPPPRLVDHCDHGAAVSPSVLLGRRSRAMRLALVIVFLAMVVQLINVQEFSHRRYASLSAPELTQTVSVPAVRGGIYDRNGEVLAESVTKQTVVADPLLITRPAAAADALAPVLGLPDAKLRAQLTEHSGFVYLAHRVPDAVAAKVTALNLTGINLVPEPQRVQPDGQLALPVVGTVNWNGDGASGLEYQYQSLLAGRAGTKSLMQAPDGVAIPGPARPRPRPSPAPGWS